MTRIISIILVYVIAIVFTSIGRMYSDIADGNKTLSYWGYIKSSFALGTTIWAFVVFMVMIMTRII